MERYARLDGERPNVILRLRGEMNVSYNDNRMLHVTYARRADAAQGVFRGRTQVVENLIELVDVATDEISTLEWTRT